MQRRTVLRTLGATAAVGLAGCGGRGADPDAGAGSPTDTESPTETATPTDTQTPTPTATPSLSDSSLTVGSRDCGAGADSATVGFESTRVTVEGVIGASNPCYTPDLRAASYDAGTDTLTVTVGTTPPEEGTVCASCVGDLAYTVTAQFEGGLPARVVVVHEGLQSGTVTEATRE